MSTCSVAYVGPFGFPSDAANSFRVLGIAQALSLGGCDVVIGSADHCDESSVPVPGGRPIQVVPLGEFPSPGQNRFARVMRGLIWGGRTKAWLKSLERQPDAILVYGTHFGYLVRLIPYARRRSIRIFADVVEWYEPSHLPGGRFGPFALANFIAMRLLAPKVDGAVCISSYLQTHFDDRGTRTVLVPPLFSRIHCPSRRASRPNRLRLSFAGTAGGKDRLTVENVARVVGEPEFIDGVELHLIGLDSSDVEALTGSSNSANIICHGRTTRAKAIQIVADSDFTLLQRPQMRYANAGFPSKISESLIEGTPVIANITSDLGKYLIDGTNAVVLKDETVESLRLGLARAMEERANVTKFDRDAIADLAANDFSPKSASGPLSAFLRKP